MKLAIALGVLGAIVLFALAGVALYSARLGEVRVPAFDALNAAAPLLRSENAALN